MAFDFDIGSPSLGSYGHGYSSTLPPPEDPHGLLSSLGTGALTGLQYVGGALDKPGRAIRGLLSGNVREGLAAIPFSDYMGITDEKQAVGGRDLLRKAGLVGEEDTWGNWGAGLAAEIALDPLSYFGGSALTQAGKAVSKAKAPAQAFMRTAGQLDTAKLAAEAAGKYLAPTKAARIAAGQANLFEFGAPTFFQSAARKLAPNLPELRIGIGSGPQAIKRAEQFGRAKEAIGALPGIKNVTGLLNQRYNSFIDPEMQKIAAEHVRPTLEEGLPIVSSRNRIDIQKLRDAGVPTDAPFAAEWMRALNENMPQAISPATQNELATFRAANPAGAQAMDDVVRRWQNTNDTMATIRRNLGSDLQEYGTDALPGMEYGARYGDFTGDASSASRTPMGIPTGSDIARHEVLRQIPTNTIHEISKDAIVTGNAARSMPLAQRVQYIDQKYLNPLGYKPVDRQRIAKEMAGVAEHWGDDVLEKGIFPHNPIEDQSLRELRELKSVVNIKARHAGLADHASPMKGSTPSPGYMLMTDALPSVGLGHNGFDALGNQIGAKATQAEQLTRRVGRAVSADDVARFQVPIDLVKKMNTPQQLHKLSAAEIPFGKAFSAINNAIRTGVTLPWPGFHVRNKASGTVQNVLAKAYDPTASGAWSYLKPEKQMNDLILKGEIPGLANDLPWLGATDAEASMAFKNLMHDYDVWRPGMAGVTDVPEFAINKSVPGDVKHIQTPMAAEALGRLAQGDLGGALSAARPTGKGMLESLKPFAEDVAGKMEPRWGYKKGRKVNEEFFINKALREGGKAVGDVELRNRGSMFLAYLKQGYDPAVAKQMVDNYHFNYADISEFEKNVVRPLSSVGYTFARKNLPLAMRQLADDPGRLAATIRTGNQAWKLGGPQGLAEGEYDPTMDTYSKGFNVPIGGEYDFEGKQYQNYLSQFGLPVEEAFQRLNFKTDSWLPLDVKATGAEMLGLLSPALAKPLELATGTQLYSGKPIEDLRPIIGNTLIDQAIMGSPISRVVTSGRTLMDERKSPWEKASNLLTGIKFTDVDVERAHKWQERKVADKLLKDIPAAKVFEEVYIPKELMDTLTPEQLRVVQAIMAIKKQRRKEAALEKKQAAAR